ncbi:MAG: hypothetical protein IT342_15275 [Candidatus Melainabacteria bacterium]|nr:hypothetical protein [Candidatus Melainabacteria bacterium]
MGFRTVIDTAEHAENLKTGFTDWQKNGNGESFREAILALSTDTKSYGTSGVQDEPWVARDVYEKIKDFIPEAKVVKYGDQEFIDFPAVGRL